MILYQVEQPDLGFCVDGMSEEAAPQRKPRRLGLWGQGWGGWRAIAQAYSLCV